MAQKVTEHRPPLGFLRDQVVDSVGDYRGLLNLEEDAMLPLVDAVRLLALEQGIQETNTLERLSALVRLGVVNQVLGEDLQESFKFFSDLLIKAYLQHSERNGRLRDQVEPVNLGRKQRKMLKDSFTVINEMQDRIQSRFDRLQAMV
jgi:CBS domain-containing protein